ncbi:MAG: sulfatase-like hydrolase/transferase [Pseudomonadota bacterium]
MKHVLVFLVLTLPVELAARNVLMIVIDDMRVDERAETPNLDALAIQSTRYRNAYTTVPSCLASRTSVLSGLSPATHGFTRSGIGFVELHDAFFADPEIETVPRLMASAGYYTAAGGKVFHRQLADQWDEVGPFIPYTDQYGPLAAGDDGTFIDAAPLPDGETHPDQLTATWAVEFLAEQEQPFFLAVGFYRPHLPWRLPAEYYDLYHFTQPHIPSATVLQGEPEEALALANHPVIANIPLYDWIANAGKAGDYTRYYLAAITHTDAMIGQVLDALVAHGHDATTDIVVWSDHGFHLGEHRHWKKNTLWQESVRVPLIIRAAGLAQGDVDVPVSLLDVGPTILDFAGLEPSVQFEGVSLRSGASPVEVYYNDGRALVNAERKLIDYDLNRPGTDHMVEYDLVNDPGENDPLPPGC